MPHAWFFLCFFDIFTEKILHKLRCDGCYHEVQLRDSDIWEDEEVPDTEVVMMIEDEEEDLQLPGAPASSLGVVEIV